MTEHASDYAAEVLGQYIALAIHANIQVDMLDEEMVLEPENLAPLKLLVITQPNVPDSAMRAVGAWAREGGTLLTTSGAATADRLNDTSRLLRNLTCVSLSLSLSRARALALSLSRARSRPLSLALSLPLSLS
eukprot:COSAG04_NODE_894_length_9593_cov_18.225932_7_plen_133_part_00